MAASVDSSSLDPSPDGSATASSSSASSDSSAASNALDQGAEKPPDDTSKLRMFLGILRKFIGVADIASVRFSLPAQLLEPRPNLEYWNYLDRPETFVAIGDSDEPLDRMLEVLRFWFTKDLKYVKGKPCKPYNSALGEFFRCNWEVSETAPPIASITAKAAATARATTTAKGTTGSAASSIKSSRESVNSSSPNPSTTALPAPVRLEKPIRVSYLTEQTSHHPPVSAFYIDCPEKGTSARGFDQLSAKFTGTSIRVTAGEHNLGIFVNIHKRDDEQYQLTHPAAHLGGLLRGSLSVTVGDQCYVTCPKTKLKTILHYIEEGWVGRAQNRVEGAIFRYDPENDDKMRVKDVAERDIVARISGSWREQLYVSLGSKPVEPQTLLVDLQPLAVHPKIIPPASAQLPNESLRFWAGVTSAILAKQFSKATQVKQDIEEGQREKAKARLEQGVAWQPWFFQGSVTPLGRPELTEDGRGVLRSLQEGRWDLEARVEPGA